MGRRGTKPQPIAVKITKGTYRPCRDGALEDHVQNAPLSAAPPAPGEFGDAGKTAWNEAAAALVAMQVLSRSHLTLLARFARAHDEVAKCDRVLAPNEGETGGEYYTNRFGEIKAHPAVGARFRWIEVIRRAESELGLTPSSERSLKPNGAGRAKSKIPSRKRA